MVNKTLGKMLVMRLFLVGFQSIPGGTIQVYQF